MSQENDQNEQPGSPTGDVAIIGDETKEGRSVSMQLIQDIYNEFTGKTEEISQGYSKSFQVTLIDIEQLNAKINQVQEQYNICSKNCSVTIYYLSDTRERFSSFERFKLYDASRLSPVESVLLQYNFLIKLPNINRLQSYTISIRLASRIATIKKMKEEIPEGIPLRALYIGRTANVSINYVDYLVARNFQDTVKGWIDGLEEHKFPKWFKLLQRKSYYIPIVTKYSISGLVFGLILKYLPTFLPVGTIDLNHLAKFQLLAFMALFVSFRLAAWLGTISESAVDNFLELSYLRLNKGDEKEIKMAQDNNKAFTIRAIAGIIGTLVLGILASLIANYISM